MAGNISSLGIGSGVLTADVIDQLKTADEARIIKPIDNKITFNDQKQKSYDMLSSLMTTFKSSVSELSYDTLFDNKTVNVSGDAEVTVDAGANVESFTLETTTLAKKDITDFGTFDSKTNPLVASGDSGVLNLSINGTTYGIDYDDTTTLSSLAQSITDKAGSDISASILETGKNKFSLVLSSTATGANQTISINDTDDGTNGNGALDGRFDAYDASNNPDGYQKIQDATDASFKYNGVDVTRSTNDISDLVLGLHITLKREGDTATVTVNQDKQKISDEVQLFVDNYNTLMTNLNDMTVFDKTTNALGVFQGDSFINGIKRDLTGAVTERLGKDSLMEYGISIDRHGVMSFDSSALDSKLQSNPQSVKTFFTGGTDTNGNDVTGFFTTLDDKVKQYTGYGGLLSNYDDGLTKDSKKLADAKTKAQASIDTRYEIMTKRFTAYDSIISRLNSQFSSLQQMISAQLNAGKN